MLARASAVAVLLAFGASAAAEAAAPRCATLVLPAGAHCADAPTGVVISDQAALAQRYAGVTAEGETRFRRHFGREPTPYAVLIGQSLVGGSGGVFGGSSAELQKMLRDAGAKHVLPWLSGEQRERLVEDSVRRTAEARLKEAGVSGDALKEGVERSVRESMAARAGRDPTQDDSAAAHELGHLWFIEAFWPNRERVAANSHYGGPAPDWLDETAAILMEDDRMTAGRRTGFRKAFTGPDAAKHVKPLPALFADPHPMASRTGGAQLKVQTLPDGRQGVVLGQGQSLPAGGTFYPAKPGEKGPPGGLTVARVMSKEEAARAGTDIEAAAAFYAQNRALADFLQERSGDPMVFGRIAAALAGGSTFEQWLAREGAGLNLGSSVAELEAAWREWATRNYGASTVKT